MLWNVFQKIIGKIFNKNELVRIQSAIVGAPSEAQAMILHIVFLILRKIIYNLANVFTFCISHKWSSKQNFFDHVLFLKKGGMCALLLSMVDPSILRCYLRYIRQTKGFKHLEVDDTPHF